jgi:hypothetical protein
MCPERVGICWYGLRVWIEFGSCVLKIEFGSCVLKIEFGSCVLKGVG